jgi:hypothetical protein
MPLFLLGFRLCTKLRAVGLEPLGDGDRWAGFVVGIRLVAEWFPPKEIGFAQGIYGGWETLAHLQLRLLYLRLRLEPLFCMPVM